jgi:hypothetical protein
MHSFRDLSLANDDYSLARIAGRRRASELLNPLANCYFLEYKRVFGWKAPRRLKAEIYHMSAWGFLHFLCEVPIEVSRLIATRFASLETDKSLSRLSVIHTKRSLTVCPCSFGEKRRIVFNEVEKKRAHGLLSDATISTSYAGRAAAQKRFASAKISAGPNLFSGLHWGVASKTTRVVRLLRTDVDSLPSSLAGRLEMAKPTSDRYEHDSCFQFCLGNVIDQPCHSSGQLLRFTVSIAMYIEYSLL